MAGAATALPSGLSWEQFLELLEQDEYRCAELIEGAACVVVEDLEADGALTSPLLPGLSVVVGAARHAAGIDSRQIWWSNGSLSSRSSM